MFIDYVNQMGEEISSKFKGLDGFAELAHEMLQKYKPEEKFNLDEVLEFSKTQKALEMKFYKNNEFGEYPITLYRNEDFLIDIYVWSELDADTHDHNFVGAFGQLQGRSMEVYYDYTDIKKTEHEHLETGLLTINDKKVLNPGDKSPIYLYEKFIHKVWHLDKPTVTICVKSIKGERLVHHYTPDGKRFTFDPKMKNDLCLKINQENNVDILFKEIEEKADMLIGIFRSLKGIEDSVKRTQVGEFVYKTLVEKYGVDFTQTDQKLQAKVQLLKRV